MGKTADFGLTQSVQDGKPIFLSVKVSLKKREDKLILYCLRLQAKNYLNYNILKKILSVGASSSFGVHVILSHVQNGLL